MWIVSSPMNLLAVVGVDAFRLKVCKHVQSENNFFMHFLFRVINI